MKKLEKAEFDIKRLSGNDYPYPLTYQYHFDERTFENVLNALSERGETFVKRAYLKMEREKVLVQYPNDEEVEEWKGQAEVEEIEKVRLMTVKEIRKKMQISQPEFGERMNIPKRTLQNWENRTSKCPEYTLGFINERADEYFLCAYDYTEKQNKRA